MNHDFSFSIKKTRFDQQYRPADNTRITTNFANLARGEQRQQNLDNALQMINQRFNSLAHWDNPSADRYALELDIISVDIGLEGEGKAFPSIEILQTSVLDQQLNKRFAGVVGNNFSSYVRDYDFSVRLLEFNKNQEGFRVPPDFGDLHAKLFQAFLHSKAYCDNFAKLPVICLSVSDNKTYQRLANQHPILGHEYVPSESSLTEQYFAKMGLQVRYFMPQGAVAPLAFYFCGDLLNDYSNLELISTISTMESFQRIYRPEIYNANSPAGACFRPNLNNKDYSLTHVVYDREERSQLAKAQGKFAEDHFIKPYLPLLQQWSASVSH